MMDEEGDGRQQDEDSEEENWTDVWDDVSCNLSYLNPCAAGPTNQKLPHVTEVSAKENYNQGNKSTIESATKSTLQSTNESSSRPSFLRMGLNDNKAGMEGLDKEHINRVIMDASRGSKFYENQLKKEAVMQRRINEQQRRLEQLSEAQILEGRREADQVLADLESSRDLSHTIVHLDMDAFYAAVEMRDNPVLRTKPMAVGGLSMLSTSNYLARRYGVRAAMPGFIAKKLCPDLTIVPCNFDKYIAVSKDIRGIMSEYDPNFCPMSLDEAYIDLTDHAERRKHMSEEDRTFSKRVDPTLLCCCEGSGDRKVLVASHELETSGVKTTIMTDETETESEKANVDVKLGSVGEGRLEMETPTNADKVQVSVGDDKGQNWKQEIDGERNRNEIGTVDSANGMDKMIEKGANQNGIWDSANGIDDQIETQVKENNNLCSANGIGADEKIKNENNSCPVGSLSHVCIECGKPRDPSLLAEKVTFGTSAEEAVNEMRFRIEAKTQLTASAGIAPNTMLAKVCSDKNKPNGQYTIASSREAVMTFINDLPLKKVCGIGKVSEQMLRSLGVVTCHDLYLKRGLLFHLYSTTSFHHFMQICAGIGSTRVERDGERKSISVERTFPALCRPAELYKKCYELSEKLAEDLREEAIMGKTVTLKLKTVKFETMTRAQSLLSPTADLEQIYSTARDLLRAEMQNSAPEPLHLRLMGVRMSNLTKTQHSEPRQGTILGCFRKIQTKGSESQGQSAGDPGSQINRDMNTTARQGTLNCVLSCDSDVGESQQCYSCNNATSQNREFFFKRDGHGHGNDAIVSESSVDLGTENTDLLSGNGGQSMSGPREMSGEHLQNVLGGTSQWNTPTDDTHAESQCDTAGCGGRMTVGDTVSVCHQGSTAESLAVDVLTCPVCDIPQRGCDLAEFNSHVDSCLSKRAVRELLEADKIGQNSASCSKRSNEECSEKRSGKKRRSALMPSLQKRRNIESFFKGGPN